jgi:hypothetical protein
MHIATTMLNYSRHSQTYQSYALPNPRAVVVKVFHAVITDRTVWASRWSVQHAGVTVLDLHNDPIYDNILCPWQPQLLRCLTISSIIDHINSFRFRRMGVTRHYTRISTRGKKQQCQILENKRNKVQSKKGVQQTTVPHIADGLIYSPKLINTFNDNPNA